MSAVLTKTNADLLSSTDVGEWFSKKMTVLIQTNHDLMSAAEYGKWYTKKMEPLVNFCRKSQVLHLDTVEANERAGSVVQIVHKVKDGQYSVGYKLTRARTI